ncbi:MAG: helicase C-terminal domain-containing protein [Chloroflexota bacterium]|nr:helicase C-terminal domain-containing protein [Chloroflexota bacterium]
MTLFETAGTVLDEAWVAFDIETTGLSSEKDKIIEIGAVKFLGSKTIDEIQMFVNPKQKLDKFITNLTGITDSDLLEGESVTHAIAALTSFVGTCPIVGHNISFDLSFLEKYGFARHNRKCDTFDMAYIALPSHSSYSLDSLADWAGRKSYRFHRALDDAKATRDVFSKLLIKLSHLDFHTAIELHHISKRSRSFLADIIEQLAIKPVSSKMPNETQFSNLSELNKRLSSKKELTSGSHKSELHDIDISTVDSLLDPNGPVSSSIKGFEERPEQLLMAEAITQAINQNNRLIVEAGTGVGKSLAYLLPSSLYALENNKRVVVSTNTITLQEQLINKDVPNLTQVLTEFENSGLPQLNFSQLKGRANYLCLRRWEGLKSTDPISSDEARLLCKTRVWLNDTETGDRTELNLGHRAASAPWNRMSAEGSLECMNKGTPCFLRAAREKASESHIVIVNHALLMSDLKAGGGLIPEHDILIIDEAHHLEREATKHLGFELFQSSFSEYIESLSDHTGLLNRTLNMVSVPSLSPTRKASVEKITQKMFSSVPRVRNFAASTFSLLSAIIDGEHENDPPAWQEFRVQNSIRTSPDWSELEIEWENLDLILMELETTLRELFTAVEGLEANSLPDYDNIIQELLTCKQTNTELRSKLREFIAEPSIDGIYWVTRTKQSQEIVLRQAPLKVGPLLEELLFSQKQSVVMTSATLSTNGNFDHLVARTGFSDADELLLGSPFDYSKTAMVCVPNDMPEPNSYGYQSAVEQSIRDAVIAADGRTMVLFTSHASLQTTASKIRSELEQKGFNVLAQGLDGTPAQLIRKFRKDSKSLLLGTASFWEGVDLPGDSLRVLLVTRLPFNVPSEPVFSARSELYENAFTDFAVPEAVLRLRQGFGRLIRRKDDRGVAIILDRRVTSKRYGKVFLDALPEAVVENISVLDIGKQIQQWLGA